MGKNCRARVMQCQETVLLTSSLISLLGSTVILVCLVSISLPHLFTGNLLADNLAFMETFLQEELVKYDIDIDIRQYRDEAIIVLYTTSAITILESILLVLGIKTRRNLLLLPWLIHFSLESSLTIALVALAAAGLYSLATLPGSVAISVAVIFAIFSSIILWSFNTVL